MVLCQQVRCGVCWCDAVCAWLVRIHVLRECGAVDKFGFVGVCAHWCAHRVDGSIVNETPVSFVPMTYDWVEKKDPKSGSPYFSSECVWVCPCMCCWYCSWRVFLAGLHHHATSR